MNTRFLDYLRCPATGMDLVFEDGVLRTSDGSHKYEITVEGIPLFAESVCSEAGRVQQRHHDTVSDNYLSNLDYPHTQVYNRYLDEALFAAAASASLDDVAELCCGRAEAFQLLGDRVKRGVGVDVSLNMLTAAQNVLPSDRHLFVQADATILPIKDSLFDSVFMIGGVHHVNDRAALFREIHRILKPGGRFFWREPVSDFFLWRWLRAVIYRVSPALDQDTERPLLYEETVPHLRMAGMELEHWNTYGFLGFCFLMNSDVLVFNRLFRFIPHVRTLTQFAVDLDDWTVRQPGFRRAGLQVVGSARKPA